MLQVDTKTQRRQAFDEIVMKYPYPELRDKDSKELREMCLLTKSNIQTFDQANSLEDFLNQYLRQNADAALLPELNRTAETFLRGVPISFQSTREVEILLRNKNEEFKKRLKRLQIDVQLWISEIKKALRKRKEIWDTLQRDASLSASDEPTAPLSLLDLDSATKQSILNELETRESPASGDEVTDLYPKADAKVYTQDVRNRLGILSLPS